MIAANGGTRYDFGAGEVSETADGQTLTSTAVGGELLWRAGGYVTSDLDFGICYSPGADVVGGGVNVDLCIGTDDVHLGLDFTVGNLTGGFSLSGRALLQQAGLINDPYERPGTTIPLGQGASMDASDSPDFWKSF